MTWILGSVDPIIVLNLRPYKTAKSMWEYLKKVYNQDNIAQPSQLEYEISRVPEDSLSIVQEIHAQSKRDQFLMKLRPEFEATRSNLMNRNPVPSLDICFGELLREEQRLTTQATYQHDKMISNAVAYAAQGKGKGRDMRNVQCFICKEYGHIATNCTRKFCNYCKKPRHIIKECPTRPQNRQANAH
ncbi:hypothetical protein Patl1_30072 [Pistacia atlantica]|uniref:Uncharacterized protein n=1 Tax=Pistacia atlantica TaxID=434234 RepID=A0ACC1AF12_9ROSI|nr:hypothetical protein Patl1_30072 [Pistacia atlantica]